MKLNNDEFLKVVENTPLVSIDLIVRNVKGHILMGKRKNNPARGSWFVPGGRIKKGQDRNEALARIGDNELNVELTRDDVRFIGVFEHYYENENFAEKEGVSTQYIVIAYECYIDLDIDKLPNEQHSNWDWFCESRSGEVHKNSAAYFKAVKVGDIDAAYSALNARRDAFNNLLWQTPVMSLIAQAFLFTIILSPDTETIPRIIAVILAVITSLASLQLLVKHRYGEEYHAKKLCDLETVTGRYPVNQYHEPKHWFAGRKSFRIWCFFLLSFGITALLIQLLVIFWPHLITVNRDVNLSASSNLVTPEQETLGKPIGDLPVGAEKDRDCEVEDGNLQSMERKDVIR